MGCSGVGSVGKWSAILRMHKPADIQFAMRGCFGCGDVAGDRNPVDVPADPVRSLVVGRPRIGRAITRQPDLGQRAVAVGQHVERADVLIYHGDAGLGLLLLKQAVALCIIGIDRMHIRGCHRNAAPACSLNRSTRRT
jgi:hypothetical protein